MVMKRKSNTEETNNENNQSITQTIPIEIVADSMDKTIFFSVSEAKKRTNTIHKKRLEVEMLPIYSVINEAINNGKYNVDEIKLTESQKLFLVNKNFGVSYKRADSYGNGFYKIYWN